MLEPVPNAEKVFYVSLEEDLSKVATDLGLGLLPDEMEKVKDYFQNEGRKVKKGEERSHILNKIISNKRSCIKVHSCQPTVL